MARYRKKEHLEVNINIKYRYSLLDKLLLYMGFDRCSRREERQRLGTAAETCAGFPTLLKWQNMARQCPRLLTACLSDLANGNVSPNFSSRCQSNIFLVAKSRSSLCSDPLPVLRFLLNSDLPDFASLATLSINAHSCQPGPGMAV